MTMVMVKPWTDPVLDVLGHDPRSWYVETFWLPTLGPTSVLLLRHLADRFDRTPDGLALDVTTTSECLGLGPREGNSSPLRRSLSRLEQFDLATSEPEAVIRVRRNLPPVNRRHVKRLPASLQARHAEWIAATVAEGPLELAKRRARRVAITLFEQGDELDHVERALGTVGFHPAVGRDAARWAWDQIHGGDLAS
ncbi:MAG TPA: hypothetical protein VH914_22415 [Acidimicrobiia bacterium]|nr:hypothetical protein [Acidimicrobiia bacterium]